MFHPSRGGVRGGADQFEWDDVKADKHRECYLGHSIKAPVGRWQKGKDLQWYTRSHQGSGTQLSNNEEKDAIKRMEAEVLDAALGKGPMKKPQTRLTKQERAEFCRKGQLERDSMDIERVEGMGFGRTKASIVDQSTSPTKETTSALILSQVTPVDKDKCKRKEISKKKKHKKEKKLKKRRRRRDSSDLEKECTKKKIRQESENEAGEKREHKETRRRHDSDSEDETHITERKSENDRRDQGRHDSHSSTNSRRLKDDNQEKQRRRRHNNDSDDKRHITQKNSKAKRRERPEHYSHSSTNDYNKTSEHRRRHDSDSEDERH